MKLMNKIGWGLGAVGSVFAAVPAWAQEAAAAAAAAAAAPAADAAPAAAGPIFQPSVEQMATMVNKGDTAWMLVCAVLVLLMSIPAIGLFYGGLVRTKNMLSILMQTFMIACVCSLLWVCYGYSLAFTGGSPFIGGFSKAFLSGVSASTYAATFSNNVYLPEYAYVVFQMTFAALTPALIVGAFAERVKFTPIILFCIGWSTLAYYPVAHMVWYWAGPDFLKANPSDAGYLYGLGALDFAGGTVVHINAGIAGLVGCLFAGKRTGLNREPMPPHSLTMTMVGAALLWVGWFGFNAGSNLEANGVTGVAFINTFVATAAAAVSWALCDQIVHGKPSLLGAVTGAVAGLVAITPASGFAAPMTSIILGLLVSPLCFAFVTSVKKKLGYDDTLDVFGVHCIGGIFGAIMTGVFADPALGGQGWFDYTQFPAVAGTFDMAGQVITQIKAVAITLVWSGGVSAVLFFILDKTIGLRAPVEAEYEGLDLADHGERAYNY